MFAGDQILEDNEKGAGGHKRNLSSAKRRWRCSLKNVWHVTMSYLGKNSFEVPDSQKKENLEGHPGPNKCCGSDTAYDSRNKKALV